jgi:steroid 5-alpha reductase family enzyme
LVYALPYFLSQSNTIGDLFWKNVYAQLAIFLPIVQLPALLKNRMSYVDIGWPLGLCALALTTMIKGTGYQRRRLLCCSCLLLHGARMGLGALAMFFPYNFKEDLPRYQYAKVRFENQDGMASNLWPIKIQHDTLQQALMNSVVLAAPFLCLAQNPSPSLHPLELLGAASWLASWSVESLADVQKLHFMKVCKDRRHTDPSVKTAVLGYAPFDGKEYFLWTFCRHPNYFFEWMCWNSFTLMGVPSLLALKETRNVKLTLGLSFIFASRIFYDCLNYWTGSEPAEHFSAGKRPDFKEYQKKTRVFFPFETSIVLQYTAPAKTCRLWTTAVWLAGPMQLARPIKYSCRYQALRGRAYPLTQAPPNSTASRGWFHLASR